MRASRRHDRAFAFEDGDGVFPYVHCQVYRKLPLIEFVEAVLERRYASKEGTVLGLVRRIQRITSDAGSADPKEQEAQIELAFEEYEQEIDRYQIVAETSKREREAYERKHAQACNTTPCKGVYCILDVYHIMICYALRHRFF